MALPEGKDVKALADTLKVATVDIGMAVPAEWAYESLGIPMPKEGEATIGEPIEPPEEPDELPDDEPDDPDGEDMRPTEDMAANAKEALEARRMASEGSKPLTRAQVDRAKRIARREVLTGREVRKMAAQFEAARATRPDGDATGTPWLAAWKASGGDAGDVWTSARK
jgi:phage gp29-like protein